ncbi:MAG: integrin alpha [Planctomycetota bacterium]|nr:integrin alpha [Planctomycetota bacterium]
MQPIPLELVALLLLAQGTGRLEGQEQDSAGPGQPIRIAADMVDVRGSAFLAAVADLNGDRCEELLVGAPNAGKSKEGRVQLLSGRDGDLLHEWEGLDAGSHLGSDMEGWTTGDGGVRLAFGSPGAAGGHGRVGVVDGEELGAVHWIEGADDQWAFGFALDARHDCTGDGVRDLVVGAPGQGGRGSVTVIDGFTREVVWTARRKTRRGLFGHDVAMSPDVDDDGTADVLVGHLGVGGVVLSGADGVEIAAFGGSGLGPRVGSSVTVLHRGGGGPLFVLAAEGRPRKEAEALPGGGEIGVGIHTFDPSGRPVETAYTYGRHVGTAAGLRVRSAGDFDGDGHDDLAVCQPNGYLVFGPTGLFALRSGATDADLGTTYYAGVGFSFPAYHFASDACALQLEERRVLVIACPSEGGVVAVEAGPEAAAKQTRRSELPQVWLREDS